MKLSKYQNSNIPIRAANGPAPALLRVQPSAASARPATQPNVSAGPRVMPGPG